jgi:hypothetical protein
MSLAHTDPMIRRSRLDRLQIRPDTCLDSEELAEGL